MSSMGNGMLSLWRPTHGRLLYHLRGQGHVTSCLEVVGEQLLSGATNGTLAIHSVFEASVSGLEENMQTLMGWFPCASV